jgi:hypothetical protein
MTLIMRLLFVLSPAMDFIAKTGERRATMLHGLRLTSSEASLGDRSFDVTVFPSYDLKHQSIHL